MERMLFVDGVYPDFSLLEEVLSPPCLESPSTAAQVERDGTLQYLAQPPGGSAGQAQASDSQNTSRASPAEGALETSAKDAALQYREVTGRGRSTSRNRSILEKSPTWRPPSGHIPNLKNPRNKMKYLLQIPQPDILYFLQESVKRLPKVAKRELQCPNRLPEDIGHSRKSCPVYKHNCNPYLWHYYKGNGQMSNSTSNQACLESFDAMELLNLISFKCTRLEKLLGSKEDGLQEDTELRKNEHGFRGFDSVLKSSPLVSEETSITSTDSHDLENNIVDKWQNPMTETETIMQNVSQVHGSCIGGKVLEKVKSSWRDEKKDVALENGSLFNNVETDLRFCDRKTPRKQKTPVKSVEKHDPAFRGVELQMHLQRQNFGDCQLIMSSVYRGKKRQRNKKSKPRINSSGSDEDPSSVCAKRTKKCASCKTQKTPLWRDAEDGTPLCNACGIRYKKYGVRCYGCWNIPKKDGKSCSKYCECGGTFRVQI